MLIIHTFYVFLFVCFNTKIGWKIFYGFDAMILMALDDRWICLEISKFYAKNIFLYWENYYNIRYYVYEILFKYVHLKNMIEERG